jgi:outer membrane protein assembly factor BamE (lipoprotein component of BamABCDE complex)
VETFLVRLDNEGVLVSIEQVLDDEHFAQIKAGEMTQDNVLHLIGPPLQTMVFPTRNEIAWDYHYRDLWGYRTIFSVLFNKDGRVKGKVSAREDGGGDGRH